jgi:hypothetical protein
VVFAVEEGCLVSFMGAEIGERSLAEEKVCVLQESAGAGRHVFEIFGKFSILLNGLRKIECAWY